MREDILPPSLRRRFQDSYAAHSVLRHIELDFADAGLSKVDPLPGPAPGGERQRLVAQYYAAVDWSDRDDVARVLSAWEAHLQRLEDSHRTDEVEGLRRALNRSGYRYSDGRISPTGGLPDPTTASPLTDVSEDLWKPLHFRLFLSHVSAFKAKIALLRKELGKYQIDGFVAHEDIEPTREWQTEIERALTSMDALAAVLSDGFNASKWTDQEVGWALGRGVPVVAVIRDIDPYGFIGKRQGIITRGKSLPEVAEIIFRVLVANDQTRGTLRRHLVSRLARSMSWDSARRNLGLVQQTGPLSEEDKELLIKAYRANAELHFASGVRRGLSDLVGIELPEVEP